MATENGNEDRVPAPAASAAPAAPASPAAPSAAAALAADNTTTDSIEPPFKQQRKIVRFTNHDNPGNVRPITLIPVSPISVNTLNPISLNPVSPISLNPINPISLNPLSTISLKPASPISLNPLNPISMNPVTSISLNPISPISLNPVSLISMNPVSPISMNPVRPITSKPLNPISLNPFRTTSTEITNRKIWVNDHINYHHIMTIGENNLNPQRHKYFTASTNNDNLHQLIVSMMPEKMAEIHDDSSTNFFTIVTTTEPHLRHLHSDNFSETGNSPAIFFAPDSTHGEKSHDDRTGGKQDHENVVPINAGDRLDADSDFGHWIKMKDGGRLDPDSDSGHWFPIKAGGRLDPEVVPIFVRPQDPIKIVKKSLVETEPQVVTTELSISENQLISTDANYTMKSTKAVTFNTINSNIAYNNNKFSANSSPVSEVTELLNQMGFDKHKEQLTGPLGRNDNSTENGNNNSEYKIIGQHSATRNHEDAISGIIDQHLRLTGQQLHQHVDIVNDDAETVSSEGLQNEGTAKIEIRKIQENESAFNIPSDIEVIVDRVHGGALETVTKSDIEVIVNKPGKTNSNKVHVTNISGNDHQSEPHNHDLYLYRGDSRYEIKNILKHQRMKHNNSDETGELVDGRTHFFRIFDIFDHRKAMSIGITFIATLLVFITFGAMFMFAIIRLKFGMKQIFSTSFHRETADVGERLSRSNSLVCESPYRENLHTRIGNRLAFNANNLALKKNLSTNISSNPSKRFCSSSPVNIFSGVINTSRSSRLKKSEEIRSALLDNVGLGEYEGCRDEVVTTPTLYKEENFMNHYETLPADPAIGNFDVVMIPCDDVCLDGDTCRDCSQLLVDDRLMHDGDLLCDDSIHYRQDYFRDRNSDDRVDAHFESQISSHRYVASHSSAIHDQFSSVELTPDRDNQFGRYFTEQDDSRPSQSTLADKFAICDSNSFKSHDFNYLNFSSNPFDDNFTNLPESIDVTLTSDETPTRCTSGVSRLTPDDAGTSSDDDSDDGTEYYDNVPIEIRGFRC